MLSNEIRTSDIEPIYSSVYESEQDVPWHEHAGMEIVYIAEGTCTMFVESQQMECKPRDLIILPTMKSQRVKIHSPSKHFYSIFTINKHLVPDTMRILKLKAENRIPRWIEDLGYIQHNDTDNILSSKYLLLAIVNELNRIEYKSNQTSTKHPAIQRALEIIEENLKEPLPVLKLAKQVGFSESHFRTLFRSEMGLSPHTYAQEIRLKKAAELLRDPYQSISEICYECGYDNPNYFVRLFKKKFSMPPGRWRKAILYPPQIQSKKQ